MNFDESFGLGYRPAWGLSVLFPGCWLDLNVEGRRRHVWFRNGPPVQWEGLPPEAV